MGILVIVYGAIYFLICCWLNSFLKRQQGTKKRSEILYNASVTENGVAPEEVFEKLHQAGIEPNFLGNKE